MKTINMIFVYGAGPDTGPLGTGGGLRQLQSIVKTKFKDAVYSPRIIDWTEYATLVRLLRQYKDDSILVGHSCGCYPITRASVELSMERIPYLLAIAPSIDCPIFIGLPKLAVNVGRATQATSNKFDIFNPGGRMLLSLNSSNNKTKLDSIYTGERHINAPYSQLVSKRLLLETEMALG